MVASQSALRRERQMQRQHRDRKAKSSWLVVGLLDQLLNLLVPPPLDYDDLTDVDVHAIGAVQFLATLHEQIADLFSLAI